MDLYLERQYAPSLFSKRFQNTQKPNEEVLKAFLSSSEKSTKLAHSHYNHQLNVRYGGLNDNQLMDIFYKNEEEGTPILVYIHGGLWQQLDRTTSGPLVHTVADQNYRVILLDYDLCPTVCLEDILGQMFNFFLWLRKYAFETKAPTISLCGHSAGAHLAMSLFKDGYLEPVIMGTGLIDKVFLISGLYDLRELRCLMSVNPNNILNLNAEKAVQLSPLYWSYNKNIEGVKFHIIVAENDSERFKEQSTEYYNKLKQLNLQVFYEEFANYDHFNIIEECAIKNSPISCYIRRNLMHT